MDFCSEHNGPYITSRSPRIRTLTKAAVPPAIKGDGHSAEREQYINHSGGWNTFKNGDWKPLNCLITSAVLQYHSEKLRSCKSGRTFIATSRTNAFKCSNVLQGGEESDATLWVFYRSASNRFSYNTDARALTRKFSSFKFWGYKTYLASL